ncbi:hypothetical protein ACFU9B_44235 [Streptomyces sp. NPDC057592]|uniref:hypothetical protein n=1 Tax=unclassified Streptomyces TaxID=2593676 RepID=UPI0036921033
MAAWVSAITAALGLVLGFFGLPFLVNSPTARPPAPTVTVTETVTAQPPGASGASRAATPTTSPDETAGDPSGVYKSMTVDIAQNYGIDLDDDPLRPESRDADKELYEFQGILWAAKGAQLVVLDRKEKGDYRTCSTVTRFEKRLDWYMDDGTRFCIISPSGLIALAEYVGGGSRAPYISLRLTIWNGTY